MSGSTSASHCSTRGRRTFNELMFQVANRITRRPPSSQPDCGVAAGSSEAHLRRRSVRRQQSARLLVATRPTDRCGAWRSSGHVGGPAPRARRPRRAAGTSAWSWHGARPSRGDRAAVVFLAIGSVAVGSVAAGSWADCCLVAGSLVACSWRMARGCPWLVPSTPLPSSWRMAGGLLGRWRLGGLLGRRLRRRRRRPSSPPSSWPAAFLVDGAAAPAASAATASPSWGSTTEAMFGTAQSMLRRAGAKLATTSVTASPTFITSRALRGGGSDIRRSGT